MATWPISRSKSHVLAVPSFIHGATESISSRGNTSDLHWKVVVQISAGLTVSEHFLSPSRQMQEQYLKLGHILSITFSTDCSVTMILGFPPRRPGLEPRSGHVGFVVDKVALGQIFSEYFGFPCQFSFHRLLHIHHHLSFRARTTGQLVADVPNGLRLIPPKETKTKTKKNMIPSML
jgi:hypothetical protein